MKSKYIEVADYIKRSWKETFRFNQKDDNTLIGLPYEYTVMCKKDMFQEMYYWDTYFTNKGLLIDGYENIVKNNIENLFFMLEKFGFVPNGNRSYFLTRSQPPYLSMMVYDYYEKTKDLEWLEKSVVKIEKEYDFWMKNRITSIGLNQYRNHGEKDYLASYNEVIRRLNKKDNESLTIEKKQFIGSCFMSECESGWDFSPRFEEKALEYVQVDLNSNLYIYESNFVYFYKLLNNKNKVIEYTNKMNVRKNLMIKYLYDEEKEIFLDYNFVNKTFSNCVSCASFHPYYALITPPTKKGLNFLIEKLETKYGLAATEKKIDYIGYQWAYPNGWAPLHLIAFVGLKNYGFEEKANKIGLKFLDLVTNNFKLTNSLWEKYNVIEGNTRTVDEYEMPKMMGWTSGVFQFLYQNIQ